MNEIYSTSIRKVKREVHVTFEVKDYTILVVCKNNLPNYSSISNSTLVVSKCNDIIPSKFKAVKFTL